MQKIDQHIQRAIARRIAADNMGQNKLAERLGISQATLSKWLAGQTAFIRNPGRWQVLYDEIKDFLPPDYKPAEHINEDSLLVLLANIFNELPRLQQLDVLKYAEQKRIETAGDDESGEKEQ